MTKTSIFLSVIVLLAGCGHFSERERWMGGLALGTAYLAASPSNEIEQVYYIGIFDPQEQLPPQVYRIRVRGQASAFSRTRFASGWVRAEIADSLSDYLVRGLMSAPRSRVAK